MTNQLEDQMTGRMMLVRLGGAIAFIGRSAFFLSTLVAATLIGSNIVDVACGGENAERYLYDAIQHSAVIVVGAFALLMVCSAICWIITGLGDLMTFLLYLVARLGTFSIVTGFAIIGFVVYMRFGLGMCRSGSPLWIMFGGMCTIVTGFIIHLAMLAILGWYREKLEEEQLRARGA